MCLSPRVRGTYPVEVADVELLELRAVGQVLQPGVCHVSVAAAHVQHPAANQIPQSAFTSPRTRTRT